MEEERKEIPADNVLLQQEEDEEEQNGEILLKLDEDEDDQDNVENQQNGQNQPQPIQQQLIFKSDEQLEDNDTKNQQLIFVNEESTESVSTLPAILYNNSESIPQLQESLSNNRMIVSQVSEPETLINTVDYHLKIIELEMISNKKLVEQLYMDNQSAESQFKLQLKAWDNDNKEIFKNLLIFNHPKQLFEQLESYPFLLSFIKITQSHLEQCIFNHEDHFKKSYFHNNNKYYLIKSEDGEYHGQTNSYLVPEGYGIMYYSNGTSYKGMFKNRHRHGQGTMVNQDGSSYSGNWEKDNEEGFGKHIDSDGEIFEGNFTDGNREGKGKLIWKNGYELEGIWRDGLAEGKSTLKVGNQTMPVIWKSGKIVEVNGRVIDHENQKTMRGTANTFPMCLIHIDIKKGSVDIEYE